MKFNLANDGIIALLNRALEKLQPWGTPKITGKPTSLI